MLLRVPVSGGSGIWCIELTVTVIPIALRQSSSINVTLDSARMTIPLAFSTDKHCHSLGCQIVEASEETLFFNALHLRHLAKATLGHIRI